MSEATVETEYLETEGEAPAATPAAPIPGSKDEVVFAGRYRIQKSVILPHLSTTSARAYVTLDSEEPKNSLYALVLDRGIPARHSAIVNAKGLVHDALSKPVRWGRADWNEKGREEIVIVLPQPAGAPLMSSLDATIQPWLVREMKRDLLVPLLDLLKRMHEARVTHRNIRPTNLFRNIDDGLVVSGQFYSAPAGFDQPSILEPIDRARCLPMARGVGDMSDELYAIGVTLMLLALGRNPVADIDEDELLRRRIEFGSYNAMLGTNKLSSELTPVVRSLMRDDAHERWSLSDLSNWVSSGRVNPTQPLPGVRADRPFEFNGRLAFTARELAHLLTSDWDQAIKLVSTNEIEHWVDRSLKNRELTKELAECAEPGPTGPKQMSSDILLSRILTLLDPTGPICFRGMRVIPDGFTSASIAALKNSSLAADFTELIAGKMMAFWHEAQARPKTWMLAASEVAEKASVYLGQTAAGFSIERCAYELNPALPCLSPLLKGGVPLQVRELIETMEAQAGDGDFLFDRHIAAFLGARIPGSIDRELTEIVQAADDSDQRMAQLRLLAYVQSKNSSTAARKLYAMFLKHLQPVLNDYHNLPMRQKLQRAARKAASRGSLNDLVRILDNKKNRSWDSKGFKLAQRRHLRLDREIQKIKTDSGAARKQATRLGQQIAANVACVIGALVLAALLISGAV
ncbi:MAG: hypothetical protein HOJ90_03555 [Alphaproteobacteria bacterium]|jgi:hypothetical protein|nr:hypothetical protein [Alphaproteobacteria bacterium]